MFWKQLQLSKSFVSLLIPLVSLILVGELSKKDNLIVSVLHDVPGGH